MSIPDSRDRVESAEKRAAYFAALLKRLCSDVGPHPSGTPAFEEVTQIVHTELQAALPVTFRDRYLDFWQVLPAVAAAMDETRSVAIAAIASM